MKARKSDVSHVTTVAFPEYKGRKYAIRIAERLGLSNVHWGGGTRSVYRAVRLSDAGVATLDEGSPFHGSAEGAEFDIPVGVAIVEHSYWCGQDCGLTVHLHPKNSINTLLGPVST